MKRYGTLLFLGLTIIGAFFLRTYKIFTNYYFSGELGKELLYIRQYAESKTLPMSGMGTSHEWLPYGPVYYWIMIPLFNLFKGDPFILFWTALAVSLAGLLINFAVIKKIAGQKLALLSTLLMAVSPLLIWQTRLSKLHVFFWILMPLLMLFEYFLWNGQKKWIFAAGIMFGLLFSFHFSQIPVFGVIILIFWIKKDIYKLPDYFKLGVGILIPNLTYFWKARDLILWLPYRVVNVANKNISDTFTTLTEYFGKNVFWEQKLWPIGLLLLTAILVHYVYTKRKVLTRDFLPFYISTSISLMIVANILHGAPPVHYYLPIFTLVPVLMAVYLSKVKFWPAIVLGVLVVNWFSFLLDPVFYKNYVKNIPGTDIVNYASLNAATSFIVSNANGRELSVKRTGPYDFFPEGYAQNYKYLILYKGGNLNDNSGNVYKIVENEDGINVQK